MPAVDPRSPSRRTRVRRGWGWLLLACCTLAHAAGPLPQHGLPPPQGIGGPLALVDTQGRRFGLERVAGRPALLFFGFTHCGATCPVAMLTAAQVLASFDGGAAPALLFVTLDPLSDGPRELAAHLARIHPRIIGLTGRPDQVEQAAERYGVALRSSGQGLEHSAMWYLLDGRGRVRRVYPYTTPAAQLVEDLRLPSLAAVGGTLP